MTVAELQSRISARELVEWQAYELVFGPLGPGRDDVLAAMQSMYTVGSASGKPQKITNFLPRWGETREEIGGVDQEPADPAGGDSR